MSVSMTHDMYVALRVHHPKVIFHHHVFAPNPVPHLPLPSITTTPPGLAPSFPVTLLIKKRIPLVPDLLPEASLPDTVSVGSGTWLVRLVETQILSPQQAIWEMLLYLL